MNITSFDHISDTAVWIAYHRALESERPDALFHDPYARLLVGERGEKLIQEVPQTRVRSWSSIVRTRILDEMILRAVTQRGCDTIVNLAAGLDARPYRLALPSSVHWIEVDLPAILSYKQEKLGDAKPVCQLETVKMDLTNRAARQDLFARINEQTKHAMIITEGFLLYLTHQQVELLAEDLTQQPHFRWWFTEFMTPDVLRRLQNTWDKHFQNSGSRMQFALDDAEGFYRRYGWKIAEFHSALEAAHRFKREMRNAWLVRLTMSLSKQRREHYRKMSSFVLLERA